MCVYKMLIKVWFRKVNLFSVCFNKCLRVYCDKFGGYIGYFDLYFIGIINWYEI